MGQTVLVVEDNSDVREAVALYLRQIGWNVSTAEHGQKALEVLPEIADHTFLVLLDLTMPVMDGVSFRREQLADPSLAHIPVVLLSGEDDLSTTASELDVAGFLPKPFNFDDLAEAVEQMSIAAV